MSRPGDTPRVVLVHGLWNARSWLAPLAWRLRRAGFAVEGFGYPSILGGPEAAIESLVRRLRAGGPAYLIGHSLGGMLGLEALRRAPELPVERMVCLGSPLRGSGTARALAARPRLGWVLGRSACLLRGGCRAWDGRVPVGMVAGDVAHGVGRLLARLDAPSDGTVAVAETRLPGLAAHCLVHASHTGLVFSAAAARQAAAFLRDGAFLDDAAGPSARRPL
ncbi:cobalamin adenosyltransferase [Pseudoxanthomonas broegbernensis]|uniref:Cobalamin adenosyltransferase n=1 Tax=Pseudoxanthomonas broegbernensis TaxID=83619 RepID=A0A7V8K714_9GAMM|nr:alpha/beta fold hydrolase [Pseudoxanthomonas broegbernensis]KAF1685998.1 cobalamin adenosyltransferase [Pseudoxanthomonas broegbernensis]MBB6063746.1 pimeloyl-ACP methyl ester carboxylesterase [Pseudoxanthomonas broegbernensis]